MDNLTFKQEGLYEKAFHSEENWVDTRQVGEWEGQGLRHGCVSGDSTSKRQSSCRDLQQHLPLETPSNGLAWKAWLSLEGCLRS